MPWTIMNVALYQIKCIIVIKMISLQQIIQNLFLIWSCLQCNVITSAAVCCSTHGKTYCLEANDKNTLKYWLQELQHKRHEYSCNRLQSRQHLVKRSVQVITEIELSR